MADFMPAIPPQREEEEDVCRVCRVEGDEVDPLIYPCKCSGSVRFVHPDCLKQWLAQSGKKHCEICGHKYTFTKIYPDQLPETIPPTVYIRQAVLWFYRQHVWAARCILVITTWLIVLPSLNMFSLRSLLWLADHIGHTSSESNGESTVTDVIGNATEAIISNTTENGLLNTTIIGNASSVNATRGNFLKVFLDKPYSTVFGVLKRAVERWMKGDENSAISFVLRGQILSISLAAVLIGLILLREWITQHNWQEGARPQVVEQGEINPDEWMIINGVARKTADVMASILGKARNDRDRRLHRLGQEQEEREMKAQREEAGLRLAQRVLEAAGREPAGGENEEDIFADFQAQSGRHRNGGFDRKPFGEDNEGSESDGKNIPDHPDAISSALEEYRRAHRLADSRRQREEIEAEEATDAGLAFDRMMDEVLAGRSEPLSRASSGDEFEGESDSGPSRPRLERVGTNSGEEESVPMDSRSSSKKSFKEREEVAYKAPELLKKGKGKADRDDENEAGPSGSGSGETHKVEEGDIPLFLPPSPTRTASSSSSSPSNNVFRAGETIRFDESGNLIHELPRPATPDHDPPLAHRAPTPDIVAPINDDEEDWEDEQGTEAGDEPEIRQIPNGGPVVVIDDPNRPGIQIRRPAQMQPMDDLDDEPWDGDDWNGILEVVGLIGPLHGLLQNVLFGVIIMSASISIFIGLPLLIGKLFLSTDLIRTSLSIAGRTLYLIRKVTDPIVDIIFEIVKEVVALPLIASIRAAETILARKLGLEGSTKGDILSKLTSIIPLSSSSSSASTIDTEDKGKYITLLGDVLAWIGQYAYDSYSSYVEGKRRLSISNSVSDRLITVLSGYGVAAGIVGLIALPGENGGTISKELSKMVKEHAMFLKLAFFMVLELGVFPLGIGLLIDACTVPLWPGATILGRLEKLRAGPFGMMFLDWLTGTMFMYQFATLLSHIRTLCRPGTLFFIRDPADPNYSPVKDIVEKSAFSQLRKLGTSAVMYAVIVFTLFGGSCWSLAYIPYVNFLPLRLDPTFGPLTSIPFDLLFLHLVVPPTVTYIRPRHRLRKIMTIWWKSTINLYKLNTLMARRTTTTDHTKLDPRETKLENIWPILDPIYQIMFGKYNPISTKARVPSSDQVILLPPKQRKAEGGVFIALNEEGVPNSPEDKLRLLKQDRRAREASRDPQRDYEVIQLPKYWRTRVHTFIGTTLVMGATILAVGTFGPIIVGRLASGLIGNGTSKLVHDGYNWLFGAYIIYLSFSLGLFARKHIMTISKAARLRRSARSTRIKRILIRYLAGTYGLITVYGIVPFAVGLLGDVYGSTFSWTKKVSQGGRIVVHFWDTWALGTVICSLGVGLTSRISKLKPARGSLLHKLKEQFRNPFPSDLSTTHKTVLPVIGLLILLNISPFLITAFIALISKGKYTDEVYQAILEAIIPILLRIYIAAALKEYFESGWTEMRQSMIDAEYVVEEKVENYDPIKEEEEKLKKEQRKLKKKMEKTIGEMEEKSDKEEEEGEGREDDWEDEEEVEVEEEGGEGEEEGVRDDLVAIE